MQISISVKSDTGRVRINNQDHYCVETLDVEQGQVLLAVADGMGGYEAGEVASELAIATLRSVVGQQPLSSQNPDGVLELLRRATQEANQAILLGQDGPGQTHMGTTLTAALVVGADLYVSHVGDSRLYLIQGGQIRQLTEDHSVVGELMKSASLTEQEAMVHPQRHLLTSALGTSRPPRVDLQAVTWQVGDTVLLCSDGLTTHVTSGEMLQEALAGIDGLADRLIALANERGGSDNITLVAARWDGVNGQ